MDNNKKNNSSTNKAGVSHSFTETEKPLRWVHYSLIVLLCFIVAFSIMNVLKPQLFWNHFQYVDYQLHSVIEALGAIAAILVAFMPLNLLFGKYKPSYIFISTGFLVMGLLDLFHSFYKEGHGFVFIHTTALLAGGLFFFLFIFPWKINIKRAKTRYMLLAGVATIVLAIFLTFNRNIFPEMIQNGEFTPLADSMNIAAGLLFLVSAVKLTGIYIKEKNLGVLILVFIAVSSAVVGLTFHYSTAWSDSWWLWHIIRLIAFLALLGYQFWRIQIVSEEKNKALNSIKNKQEQLKESEERFKIIFENSPLGKSRTGLDGTLDINKAFTEITGYSYEELQQKNWKEITHPDDIKKSEEVTQLLISGEKNSARFEKRYLHKAGHYVWTEVNTSLYRDEAYEPQFFISTISDISEPKKVEKRIQQSERKFKNLFDSDPSAIFIADPETGFLHDTNPAAESLMEMSHEELVGMHQSQLHPEDIRHEQQEKFQKLMEQPNVSVNSIVLTKTGMRKPVEIKVSIVEMENKSYILGIFHDVSKLVEEQQKLKYSEEKHRAIFESATDAFIIASMEGKIVEVNPMACKIYRYQYNEMIGKTANTLIHPDYQYKYADFIKQIQDKEYYTGETLDVRKDQTTFSTEIHGSVINFNKKKHILAVIHDVSAKKEAEKSKEKALHDLNERVKEMNCLFDVNEAIKDPEVGIPEVMKKITNAVPKGWHYPEHTAVLIELDKSLYKSNIYEEGEYHMMENISIEGKNRGYIKVNVFNLKTEQSEQPFFEEEKELLKTIAGNISIYIHRVEAERAIRENEENFRNVFTNSPVSLWEEDWTEIAEMIEKVKKEGVNDFNEYFYNNKQFVNEALSKVVVNDVNLATLEMFEAESKDDLLKSLEVVFSTEDTLPGFIGELVALAKGKNVYETEMKLNTVKGNVIHAMLRMSFPIANENKGQVLVSIMDITPLKMAQQQLNETLENLNSSNKELERFAYIASHDLQEPLRMVSSFTQLLERRYKNQLDERADKYIHYAVDGANRMQNLINDLLDFSRISTRGDKFKKTDVNLVIKNVLANLSVRIEETGAQIKTGEFPLIMADTGQVERLFLNLVANALKFTKTGEKPIIQIDAEEQDENWLFRISDNGIGIDEKYKEKVFIIFQRLHGASEYKGTGIGLAISKRIVQRHEGEIWFESKENEGTTFLFTLKKYKIKDDTIEQ